jgi:ribose transport system substrate-binding protein
MQVAAHAVGWTEKTLQAGLTPQGVAAAYDQAVRDKPAGILGLGGFPPTLFSHQLKELKAEGVLVSIPQADPANLPGITYDPVDSKVIAGLGTEMGDYVLSDSNGHRINAAIFTTTATPEYDAAHTSFTQTIKGACPSCTVATSEFPETDIGTTLPTVVVTYLKAHPSTNYLYFDFSNEVDGVPAALQSAGLSSKVKIVTNDTTPTESAYIAAGQEAAAAGAPNLEAYWASLNVFIRASEGLPLGPGEDVQLPNWIITKANLPSSTESFPLVANYQDLFKSAWGVGNGSS